MFKRKKYTDVIDTINEGLTVAKNRGILHLFTEDEQFNGRDITVKGNSLINFGSCSYLGLEIDQRMKDASIEAVTKYGTQYSSCRTYVSCTPYAELEELVGRMFKKPFLLSTSTTLGHLAVMPIVIDDEDAVILDQYAHISMQDVVQKMQQRGVDVSIARHNKLEEVEKKVLELRDKHQKIWYVIDSVYGMFGDFAPLKEIVALLDKYKQLHLYIDDAHGMSWAGENGSGYTLSQIEFHPKMILATSLAKGFGSCGGVFVFPNEELLWRVRTWGGPLTYSGPQQPAVIGASIASAKIHLSDEIYDRQQTLVDNIHYCNQLLQQYQLPSIATSDSPIFFIGLGLTKVGYNMVNRLLEDCLYVNLGIFPGVPETCTGIRFTLTTHHSKDDIKKLVERIAFHLPKALMEEDRSMQDVYRNFRKFESFENQLPATANKENPTYLKIQQETTIEAIPEYLWNTLFGERGSFDWQALHTMEKVFKHNPLPENNWSFHYYVVRDQYNKVVLATFFTTTLLKDDMLSDAGISSEIETRRLDDPYYLTSRVMMMGSLLTSGQHLYVDKSKATWKQSLMLLLDTVWQEQDQQKATSIYFRDFLFEDADIQHFLNDQGFIKVEIPDVHVYDQIGGATREEFLNLLPHKVRYYIKTNALKYESLYEVNIAKNATQEQINQWYKLYLNVKATNLGLNDFTLPNKLFQEIANEPNWEVIELYTKPSDDNNYTRKLIGVFFSYRTSTTYNPNIIGMDYTYLESHNLYKQIIFQVLLRSWQLGVKQINFGVTASQTKKKFGAKAIPQVAYIQTQDDFNRSVLSMQAKQKKESHTL
jgi:7-keto-8-aminopelargonate synthetase-like enzyme